MVFQQFVLCHENDGRVVIEKLNSDECGTETTRSLTGIPLEDCLKGCNVCTDFSASEKFGSDKSQSLKYKPVQHQFAVLVILPESFLNIRSDYKTLNFNETPINSPPLEAYKTVSLLI